LTKAPREAIAAQLRHNARLPAILAPMYRVSGPDLVVAGCRAGIVSAIPTQTPTTIDALRVWLDAIATGLRDSATPTAGWGVSMVAHSTYTRFEEELALLESFRPAFVVTALGSPRRALDTVHGFGGLVFADVSSIRLARKAADAGADGLILVCGGAGGQTGFANPFGFVEEVRSFFDGLIILAGAVSTGHGVRAAEVMGADFAYIGTHFIPAVESLAPDEHRRAVIAASVDDIVTTSAVTGTPATFTRHSLVEAGYDPSGAGRRDVDFAAAFDGAPRPRAHAAGHGAGAMRDEASVASIVDVLHRQYEAACRLPCLY
jgi:nitronate monooxygenase